MKCLSAQCLPHKVPLKDQQFTIAWVLVLNYSIKLYPHVFLPTHAYTVRRHVCSSPHPVQREATYEHVLHYNKPDRGPSIQRLTDIYTSNNSQIFDGLFKYSPCNDNTDSERWRVDLAKGWLASVNHSCYACAGKSDTWSRPFKHMWLYMEGLNEHVPDSSS